MYDNFRQPLSNYWTQTMFGGGSLTIGDAALHMGFAGAEQGKYTDAQIDDYSKLKRKAFPWRPPLRMEVEARSSLPAATSVLSPGHTVLQGTAGFGFWNYPFSPRGDILMLPEAVWFFYASPPSNMAPGPGIPRRGLNAHVTP